MSYGGFFNHVPVVTFIMMLCFFLTNNLYMDGHPNLLEVPCPNVTLWKPKVGSTLHHPNTCVMKNISSRMIVVWTEKKKSLKT
jgi:hypothetical protein